VNLGGPNWQPTTMRVYDDCLLDEFFIHHDLRKAIINDGMDDLLLQDDIFVWNEEQHASFVADQKKKATRMLLNGANLVTNRRTNK
jgi:hypothetical protein